MRGYVFHAAAAAMEAVVPWIARHHIESHAKPWHAAAPDKFWSPAAATTVGAGAIAMAFGAAIGLAACSIDTILARSSLVRNLSPSVAAINLESSGTRRRHRRRFEADAARDREVAEAALIRRPAYLMGVGASVSCSSALLPPHLLSVPLVLLLFCIAAACGASARTNAVIKVAHQVWRAEFNQQWSLAHDERDDLDRLSDETASEEIRGRVAHGGLSPP